MAETTGNSWSERTTIRFGVTFVANLLRAGLSFLAAIIVAKKLGASGYGDLSFLLGSFAAISRLLDLGSTPAFYTFLSRRSRKAPFFVVYTLWTFGVQFLGTLIVLWLFLPSRIVQQIWLGHPRGVVLLAFGASFLLSQGWGTVAQMGEAARKTLIVQIAASVQAVVHLLLIAGAVYLGELTPSVVLWLLIGEYVLLMIVLGPSLLRVNLDDGVKENDTYRGVVREFLVYCKPLIIYNVVAFLYVFADRWLLQKFGGATQQGLFAVGQQIVMISLIATTSIMQVLWKELAEALERGDRQRVRKLHTTVRRGLYFSGAWIGCLLIPHSRMILNWTVGPGYDAAWLTLSLMFLYPVHQSLGQTQGVLFQASGETRKYSEISILVMVISLPVTYLLLAPASAAVPGLGLGAVGLSIKMVTIQLLGVSLEAYVLSRINGWGYDYHYQAGVLAGLFCLGWLSKWSAGWALELIRLIKAPVAVVVLASLLYTVASLVVLYRVPSLIGLSRTQLSAMITGTARWLRLTAVAEA